MSFFKGLRRIVTKVFTWGSGDAGQLGDGKEYRTKPAEVSFFNDKKIVQVVCGGMHSMARSSEGKLYTWGCNDEGVLGRSGREDVPGEVNFGEDVFITAMAAGDSISAAIDLNDNLYTWGLFRGPGGVLGHARSQDGAVVEMQRVPKKIKNVRPLYVHTGANHIVVVDVKGDVWAWGDSANGSLGCKATRHGYMGLVPRITLTLAAGAGAGSYHSMAFRLDRMLNRDRRGRKRRRQATTEIDFYDSEGNRYYVISHEEDKSQDQILLCVPENTRLPLLRIKTYKHEKPGFDELPSQIVIHEDEAKMLTTRNHSCLGLLTGVFGFTHETSEQYRERMKEENSYPEEPEPEPLDQDLEEERRITEEIEKKACEEMDRREQEEAERRRKNASEHRQDTDQTEHPTGAQQESPAEYVVVETGEVVKRTGHHFTPLESGEKRKYDEAYPQRLKLSRNREEEARIEQRKKSHLYMTTTGANGFNQAPNVNEKNSTWGPWQEMSDPNGPTSYKKAMGGTNCSMILDQEGALWSVGRNNFGQLGVGDCDNRKEFTKCKIEEKVSDFSITASHAIALARGEMYSWGFGEEGQLGYEAEQECTPRKVPLPVSGPVISVGAGGQHSAAVAVVEAAEDKNADLPNSIPTVPVLDSLYKPEGIQPYEQWQKVLEQLRAHFDPESLDTVQKNVEAEPQRRKRSSTATKKKAKAKGKRERTRASRQPKKKPESEAEIVPETTPAQTQNEEDAVTKQSPSQKRRRREEEAPVGKEESTEPTAVQENIPQKRQSKKRRRV